ncbi:MAG: hypothetical protein PHS62_00340 [Patescibacteria group bacterium]|nr:hypothetical protein [Patescibacteria group bacterium]
MFDELDKVDERNQAMPQSGARPLSQAPVRPVPENAAGVKNGAGAGPVKAEDIFAEMDKTAKPEVFRSRPAGEPPRGTVVPPAVGWRSNKMLVFGLLFGGVVVVIAGGYFGLKLAFGGKQAADSTIVEEQTSGGETNQATSPSAEEANTAPIEPVEQVITEPQDTDGDGLTDEEEAAYGTSVTDADTDQDGLTDREETKVYNTDPLIPDTDGDGYKDGDEVKNGYNPKGAGKLLEIK